MSKAAVHACLLLWRTPIDPTLLITPHSFFGFDRLQ